MLAALARRGDAALTRGYRRRHMRPFMPQCITCGEWSGRFPGPWPA